jgi:hypothetical protein
MVSPTAFSPAGFRPSPVGLLHGVEQLTRQLFPSRPRGSEVNNPKYSEFQNSIEGYDQEIRTAEHYRSREAQNGLDRPSPLPCWKQGARCGHIASADGCLSLNWPHLTVLNPYYPPRRAILRCFASHSSSAFTAHRVLLHSPLVAWGRGYAPDGAITLPVYGR